MNGKKVKKLFLIVIICTLYATIHNYSSNSSKISAGIAYGGNTNKNQSLALAAADGACQVCMYYALLGSGITGGASLVVGLAVSA